MYLAVAPLSPGRVHERALQLIGHRPYWHREQYRGGFYSTEHFRTCSYCGCIHPGDLIELLQAGGRLEGTNKTGKFYLFTPNPVAGEIVRIGSLPGRVFDPSRWPVDLRHKLSSPTEPNVAGHEIRGVTPSIGERLSGHFERAALEEAPAEIKWPFYAEHTNERQWAEICTAAQHGEKK